MSSKYFSNRLDDQKTKGKRQVKGSKKNTNKKIQSKGIEISKIEDPCAVSYTHLTLPTILRV